MTKRSLAALCCLLWGLAVPVQAEEAPSLLVRVTDGDGKPVAGATVRAVPEAAGPETTETVIREETSEEGIARIAGLPVDRPSQVLVERKGYAPELRNLAHTPAETAREVRIPLRPGSLLVGQVVDEKGKPVRDAEVELVGTPFVPFPWNTPQVAEHLTRHRARTGRAGRFRFRDLPEGRFELTIRHSGHATLVADRPVAGRTAGRLGTFVLRRGETLRGTVTGADGRPVAGARVWALPRSEVQSGGFPAPSAITAADGTFTVPHHAPGAELWVCADGFLQQSAPLHFPEEPVQVRLLPAGLIRGRVLGQDGWPVAGATVTVSNADGTMECGFLQVATPCDEDSDATTDAEGRFQLARLQPTWYLVSASAPGRMVVRSSPLRMAGGEAVEVELRFQEGSTVAGRVVDSEGRPVPDATIWIGSEDDLGSGMAAAADGSFRIEGVAAGRYALAAHAHGYEMTQRNLEVSAGETRADLVLEPYSSEEVEIRGRVLGPDGAPVDGARVFSSSLTEIVHSAWDGSFTLRLFGRGQKTLLVRKPGFARAVTQLPLEDRLVDGVEIRLQMGTRVRGRVTGLTAEELRSVTLQVAGEDDAPPVYADAEGWFELGPVAAGTWTVSAYLSRDATRAEVTVEPGQAEAFVELGFPPVREVSGRVLDAGGEPLGGIEVSFERVGVPTVRAWTRADGSFLARVPEGDLRVKVQDGAREHTQPLGVETGPATGLEIRFPRGVTLRGRILGVPPWEQMRIELEGASSSRWGQVDLDGVWSLQGIPPGNWTLVVTRNETSQEIRRTIKIPDDPGLPEIEIDLDFTNVPLPADEKTEP